MKYPPITVVIPSYNEEKYIGQCLNGLLEQNYQGSISIIVADAFSSDGTRELVASIQKGNNQIKLIDNPGQYQAAGRNIAIAMAETDLVVYLDAHSWPAPDWLSNLYSAFAELNSTDSKLVGIGSIHIDAADTAFSRATTTVFNNFMGGSIATSYSKKDKMHKVVTAYACLYKREIFLQAGGYDTSFIKGEDLEFNMRLTQKLGYSLYVCPSAVTYYHKREGLVSFWKQMYSYGFWRHFVNHKHKNYSLPSLLPSLLVLFVVIGAGASVIISEFSPIYFGLSSVYLCLLLLNSILLGISKGCNPLLLLSLFLSIHFGYGLGMISGAIRKSIRH